MQAAVLSAGFEGFEVTWQGDVFSGAPQASSAAEFGTLGINFRARKPAEYSELRPNARDQREPAALTFVLTKDAL